MSGANVRVEFLRTKRYPHPDGPKRPQGAVLPIRADLARLWGERGVVRLLEDPTTQADAVEAAQQLVERPVTQLRTALDEIEDPQVVRAAAELDSRTTAGSMYAERLAQLE